jgi:hypothetical protein
LVIKSSIREGGVNQEHVRRLMRLGGRWSPILVHEGTGVVIDGVHRVAAARLLGLTRMDATLFTGGPGEALIEFVRRNVHHGLPLTLRERKWAASQVLGAHPHWSDRRIASICALSPKTVGRLRVAPRECGASEEVPQLDTAMRMGRDNRLRPVNSGSIRERVAAAIRAQPGASLRSVAASVGVSPETVRSVRIGMSRSIVEPPTIDAIVEDVTEDASPSAHCAPVGHPGGNLSLVTDGMDPRGDFVAWLDRTSVTKAECSRWAQAVPVSRADEVVGDARHRAEVWLDFARTVETRMVTAT